MEVQLRNNGIMDDDLESDIGSISSFEELKDEVTSMSSSSSSLFSLNDHVEEEGEGQFLEMSSLMTILPLKRGLSKHYDGKSQSFTSLSQVESLEDLIKPERPYKKKLKTCKSFTSRTITKKCSSKTFKA